MNKRLVLFYLGTKFEDFMATAYNFGFLLLFYELTGSLLSSGWLTAGTIAISRILIFFIMPLFKRRSPILISSGMSLVMGVAALVAAGTYSLWSDNLYCFFVVSILFSTISSLDQSFTSSIIPRIVERDYLYKANSLNGIFANVVMFIAPLVGYLFNVYNFHYILLLYGLICLGSAAVLLRLYQISGDEKSMVQVQPQTGVKLRYFSDEWKNTIRLIVSSSDILFCILIGVIINLIFAGISGPYVLGSGESAFDATLMKISIALGSFMGVYGVFILKVKEHYKRYMQLSLIGIILSLLLLANVSHLYASIVGIVLLTMFVMFIMNSTGTFLQLATPKEELASVYALRASIYAVVVPLSYVLMGWILEKYGTGVYFYLSVVEVLTVIVLSRFSKWFSIKGDVESKSV